MIAFHKNEFIEQSEAKINILSPGFQYGIGFFTTLKYQNHQYYFLNEHLNRLYNSCSKYNINFTKLNVKKILDRLLLKNNLESARIKIIIYIDSDWMGKYLIIPQKLTLNKGEINLVAKLSHRGNSNLFYHKSMNYFENIYQKNVLTETNYDDYIFFNENNNILETTISNIFFINGNKIFTPCAKLPILNGIIRQYLLRYNQLHVNEAMIDLNEINQFEACFITNSIQGIQSVKSIKIDSKIINYDVKKINLLPDSIKKL